MAGSERETITRLIDTILSATKVVEEMMDTSSLTECDMVFGTVLEKLNLFFKKVEGSFKDFVIFERYVSCAYTSELGFGLRDIPEDIRERVWEMRENTEICGFTGEECKCKKSISYLKERFSETIQKLGSFGESIKEGSGELKKGIEELGKEVEKLTLSAQKIISIAELIEIIAINAYIEAARLGEQGRGFKVIADEVRRASVRTNELASEIVEAIRNLHTRFSDQMRMQDSFEVNMVNMEKEQREFSDKLNKDLLWMAQNFMDFLGYMREYVKEDVDLLREVRTNILSALQTIDLSNQRMQNTGKALSLLAHMIEDFEKVLKGEKDPESAWKRVQALYEEFRNIPKLKEEREIVAKAEGKELDRTDEVVGKKLEETETDIELF